MGKSTLSYAEAAVVTAICFGLFILLSVDAVLAGFPQSRPTDDSDAWIIGIELMLGAAALLYLRARNFDIHSLYPTPTLKGSLAGLGVFAVSWLVGVLAMTLFATPGQREMTEFAYDGLSATAKVALAVVNGTYEEVFLLGVLVRGLRGFGLSLAIGLPLLVRVLYHLYQGPLGVVFVMGVGLVFTLSYVFTGKLWPAVLAHMLWDIVPTL